MNPLQSLRGSLARPLTQSALVFFWVLLGGLGGMLWLDRQYTTAKALHTRALEQRTAHQNAAAQQRAEQAEWARLDSQVSALSASSLFQPQDRLALLETIKTIEKNHRFLGLEAEIGAQKLLQTLSASPPSPMPFVFQESPVRLRLRALHEGDFFMLMDELGRQLPDTLLPKACSLSRTDPAPPTPGVLAPNLAVTCDFRWINISTNGSNRFTIATPASP